MKLAVVSHSLVAERQSWFFNWLSNRGLQGELQVMQIAPDRWGRYDNPGGYPIVGDTMTNYEFREEAFQALMKFKPDVVYVQEEAYCKSTAQFLRVAKRLGSKFALFVWENINPYDGFAHNILHDCDLVVCGNGKAEELVKPHNEKTLHCIQVGVSTEVFAPSQDRPKYDVIFQGRMVEEKGYKLLTKAYGKSGTPFTVLYPEPGQALPYVNLPYRYSMAKVLAAPSIDTPTWKEQHAGYASLEALSCGLYVATSDSEAIIEALSDCPGVWCSFQGDPKGLVASIEEGLTQFSGKGRNLAGREWVHKNYGYEAIAEKLLPALEALTK